MGRSSKAYAVGQGIQRVAGKSSPVYGSRKPIMPKELPPGWKLSATRAATAFMWPAHWARNNGRPVCSACGYVTTRMNAWAHFGSAMCMSNMVRRKNSEGWVALGDSVSEVYWAAGCPSTFLPLDYGSAESSEPELLWDTFAVPARAYGILRALDSAGLRPAEGNLRSIQTKRQRAAVLRKCLGDPDWQAYTESVMRLGGTFPDFADAMEETSQFVDTNWNPVPVRREKELLALENALVLQVKLGWGLPPDFGRHLSRYPVVLWERVLLRLQQDPEISKHTYTFITLSSARRMRGTPYGRPKR